MPSAITSDLYDGKDISFKQFALKCAALMFHDCSKVPTIKELKKQSDCYYKERLAELRKDYKTIQRTSDETFDSLEQIKVIQSMNDFRREKEIRLVRAEHYNRMQELVHAWQPAPCLVGLKSLMLRLLEQDKSDYSDPNWRLYKPITREEALANLESEITDTLTNIIAQKTWLNERIDFIRELRKL